MQAGPARKRGSIKAAAGLLRRCGWKSARRRPLRPQNLL